MDETRTDRDHRDNHPTSSKLDRSSTPTRVLVAGATGYVGRRLVGELGAAGCSARCLARTPAKLDDESWRDQVQVVTGDVLDVESLLAAMQGVQVAYYLVHSIGSDANWQQRDRCAAENFRDAAAAAGVEQIIYLGGRPARRGSNGPSLPRLEEPARPTRSVPPARLVRARVLVRAAPIPPLRLRPDGRAHRRTCRDI